MLCTVSVLSPMFYLFFFNAPATTEIYTLSLHDALPISWSWPRRPRHERRPARARPPAHLRAGGPSTNTLRVPAQGPRSEEHTSELQSLRHLVCRLLLEKKKKKTK